jgi:hypothetical protein
LCSDWQGVHASIACVTGRWRTCHAPVTAIRYSRPQPSQRKEAIGATAAELPRDHSEG